jgi:calcineurin-like phosphoesterase family protein
MSKIWFSADLHFNHKNIIAHAHRSFRNVDEMNEQIIDNWNRLIQQDDMVYLLGDVSWSSRTKTVPLIYRLKGRIFLIRGNHDNDILKKDCVERFEWVKDYYYLKVEDSDGPNGKIQPIILFHYPIASWNHINYGAWHLHGHCHGSLPVNKSLKRFDVGIDNTCMRPIEYERIKEIMAGREFKPVDHHQ